MQCELTFPVSHSSFPPVYKFPAIHDFNQISNRRSTADGTEGLPPTSKTPHDIQVPTKMLPRLACDQLHHKQGSSCRLETTSLWKLIVPGVPIITGDVNM